MNTPFSIKGERVRHGGTFFDMCERAGAGGGAISGVSLTVFT